MARSACRIGDCSVSAFGESGNAAEVVGHAEEDFQPPLPPSGQADVFPCWLVCVLEA